jgi:uncharacterized protein YwbE
MCGMDATTGRVTAVCVVHALIDGYFHPTAIDKRTADGPDRRPRPGG